MTPLAVQNDATSLFVLLLTINANSQTVFVELGVCQGISKQVSDRIPPCEMECHACTTLFRTALVRVSLFDKVWPKVRSTCPPIVLEVGISFVAWSQITIPCYCFRAWNSMWASNLVLIFRHLFHIIFCAVLSTPCSSLSGATQCSSFPRVRYRPMFLLRHL